MNAARPDKPSHRGGNGQRSAAGTASADLFDLAGIDVDGIRDVVQSVIMDSPDGILIVDDGGFVRACNPAAEELLARSAANLVGKRFGHPIVDGQATEVDVVRRDGTRVAEMRVGRTSVAGDDHHVVTLRDVTARRRADDALRDFVSVTSHEFRTPLTAIGGFAATMLEHLSDMPEADLRQFLGIIERQTNRLNRLASNLLAIARLEGDRVEMFPRDVSVRAAVDNALTAVGEASVVVDVDPDLIVFADADHVEEIVINFVTNAFKYGEGPVQITATLQSDDVHIAVADSGRGVPPDFAPRLFERFSRGTDDHVRRQPGTGLGLAIVASLAQHSGGRAWYQPNEPTGSVFSVALPAGRA